MSELQSMIFETADRIFADHVTHDLLAAVEAGEAPVALWQDLAEAGLPKALCSEDQGGIGGSWADVFGVIKALGSRAVPLPLGDIMAAHWLAERAGLTLPEGAVPLLATAAEKDGRLVVEAEVESTLPTHLVALASGSGSLYFLPIEGGEGVRTISGAHQFEQELATGSALAEAGLEEKGLSALTLGAMLRAAQMAGAMEAALRITVDYANERVQFGRPIGKFQAIQQQLALLSGHVAASARAARVAFETGQAFDIACAKVVAGEAAEVATDVTHQVHGAIGFTYEYQLQFLTRRLWTWGSSFGTTSWWAEQIGAAALDKGAENLWPAITGNKVAL